jgi:hypothetical protein
MYGESVRRPDRLQHLWAHDRELTSLGTKLSSFVPGNDAAYVAFQLIYVHITDAVITELR